MAKVWVKLFYFLAFVMILFVLLIYGTVLLQPDKYPHLTRYLTGQG
jgi:preprotein translocase subunit SecG